MKKLICLLIVVLTLFTVSGCEQEKSQETKPAVVYDSVEQM